MSSDTLNAIRLNNEMAGEEGLQFPEPENTLGSRTLFSPAPKPSPSGGTSAPAVSTQGNPVGRTIVIDGRKVELSTMPADKDSFVVARLYDKTKRDKLDTEARQAFVDAATGYILPKKDKLRTLSTKEDDDGMLTHVHNLRNQLKTIRDHVVQYDLADVFTIIVPVDLTSTGAVRNDNDGNPMVYDLFVDYPRLHAAEVATSCAWYNSWIAPMQPYVRENLRLTLDLLKNNADDRLWSKCLEDYEEYHPIQQGGPLMLFLLLRRIQNSSEAAIECLQLKVKNIKISKVEGENVEHVVSLIKAAYYSLLGASTPSRSHVPDDFPKTVLEVMQTSSNSEFNSIFQHEASDARRLADKLGGLPNWPSVTETLNQAQSTYKRLLDSDKWLAPHAKRSRALLTTSPGSTTPDGRPAKRGRTCDNCEATDHILPDCPHERDETKIAYNRKARLAALRRSRPKPDYKVAKDGRRLVKNSRGLYVHDTKGDAKRAKNEAKKAAKQDKLADTLAETVTSLFAQLAPGSSTPADTGTPALVAAPGASTSTAPTLASQRAAVKASLLAKLKGP